MCQHPEKHWGYSKEQGRGGKRADSNGPLLYLCMVQWTARASLVWLPKGRESDHFLSLTPHHAIPIWFLVADIKFTKLTAIPSTPK